MAKKFYCDYVDHCIRYYVRYPHADQNFVSDIAKANWKACEQVLTKSEANGSMIKVIFGEHGTITDGVEECAKKFDMPVATVYSVLRSIEYEIAKARGLV